MQALPDRRGNVPPWRRQQRRAGIKRRRPWWGLPGPSGLRELMFAIELDEKRGIAEAFALAACSTAAVGCRPRSSGALRGHIAQQPECSIHRVAVPKDSGNVGLEENQVRSRHRPLVVLAPYNTLQAREIVLRPEIVTASLHCCAAVQTGRS